MASTLIGQTVLSSLSGGLQLISQQRALMLRRDIEVQLIRVTSSHTCILAAATDPRVAWQLARHVQTRITVAASTGRLDISDFGLRELPYEVFKLKDLVELSCSGNKISHLPDEIGRLTNLKRLGISGNRLQELPESIGNLQQLEGLWVHGNLLQNLPMQIGELQQLRHLAIAGNRLSALPESLSGLIKLQILSVAGNNIRKLPSNIGNLKSLQVLAAYGNMLSAMPESLTNLSCLQDLWLQSNLLKEVRIDWGGLYSLKQLSLADNLLTSLPDSFGNLSALETVWLYSNQLHELPKSVGRLKKLSHAWLENNPLASDAITAVLPEIQHLKTIGISSLMELPSYTASNISISYTAGTGAAATCGGYFKLQRHTEDAQCGKADVLVVAFGSAPGVPNWGGLLKKVKESMRQSTVLPIFDILYVVDSARSWYTHDHLSQTSNGDRSLGSYYRNEVTEAVKDYKRVIMLGDSMGASAALLFSNLATTVLAFCPQVDLTTSSIRPGRDQPWLDSFTKALLGAVLSSSADIVVHCGSWSHDLEQARLLPSSNVKVVSHDVDDHRLAKVLDSRGQLVNLVQSKIQEAIVNIEEQILAKVESPSCQ